MLRLLLFCFLTFLTLGLQTSKPSVPWQVPLKYRQSELFPITLGKYGFPMVRVSVNGINLNLVWDTGNMNATGLLINPEQAKRLGLPVTGESKYYDTSGALLGIHKLYRINELNLFGRTWPNLQADEFWQTDLDGTIGPRFVLNRRFTLDYQRKFMAVSDSPLPRVSTGDIVPLISSSRYPGMIVIEGKVNGRKVLMQVDTGKSRTCVDTALVAALGLPQTNNGYEIRDVRIGHYSFAVPSARGEDFKDIGEGLPQPILLGIGSDIISQVVMSVDYSQRILALSR